MTEIFSEYSWLVAFNDDNKDNQKAVLITDNALRKFSEGQETNKDALNERLCPI